MNGILNLDFMHYTTVGSLEMSDEPKIRTPGLKRKSNQTIEAAQGRFNRLLMRQKIIKKVFLNLVIFRFIGIFVSKMIPKYVFL